MDGEIKFVDNSIVVAGGMVGGIVANNLCVQISEGAGESQRIGRNVTVLKFAMHYDLELPKIVAPSLAAPANGDNVRVIVFIDKQSNGLSNPTVTDILENAIPRTFYNLANQDRFQILVDNMHNINYKTLTGSALGKFAQSLVIQSYYIEAELNMPVQYEGVEPTSNNIGVLLISRYPTSNFAGVWRMRFME